MVAPGPLALSALAWSWAGLLFAVVLSGTRANIPVPVLGLLWSREVDRGRLGCRPYG